MYIYKFILMSFIDFIKSIQLILYTNSHKQMLTNIINNQLLSNFNGRNSRPLSANHSSLSHKTTSNLKKNNAFHNKVFKQLSSSKENNLGTMQHHNNKRLQKSLSEWGNTFDHKIQKKHSVVVIQMDQSQDQRNVDCEESEQHVLKAMESEENYKNKNQGVKNMQSVLMNPDKILLPIKQYSNKFLREKKAKAQLQINHSILKQKKSFIYVRKQVKKNRKNHQAQSVKHKQNFSRSLKTEMSQLSEKQTKKSLLNRGLGYYQTNSEISVQKPLITNCSKVYQSQSLNTPDKNQRISTSRALQMFSKVYKNQGIERMRIRKQVIMNKTTDVQVKQIKLQDKDKKQPKPIPNNKQSTDLQPQNPALKTTQKSSKNRAHKKTKNPSEIRNRKIQSMFCIDDENFEIAGW